MAMDYRGVNAFNSGGGVTPTPTPTTGLMKFVGNWIANLSYSAYDYIVYNRISYVAIQNSQGSKPDISPTFWQVVSYWSNPNNVSNFRGSFVVGTVLQQYDSVHEPTTGITYVYLGTSLYTITTVQNLINDCAILQDSPELQQQQQTPCYSAFTGNGTSSTAGLLFPAGGTIISSDLDFQTININQGFRKSGTTIVLDNTTLFAKEGLYNVSCCILMWCYQNPLNTDQFYNFGGYFDIIKVDANSNRSIVVRNEVCGPFKYYNVANGYYYPSSMKLESTVALKFNEGVTLNCTNVQINNVGFAIAPTINIKYLSPII